MQIFCYSDAADLVCVKLKKMVFELMSARTFGNNKSDYVWIRMIAFIYRSCLRDRCYTTEHKVNNDTWLLCAKVM